MSIDSNNPSNARRTRRNRRIAIAVIGFLAAAGIGLAIAPTGALFSDSKTATASAHTGHAAVSLNDTSHAATCVLDLGTVNPGHQGSATCTVTNSGTVPLNIAITNLASPSVTAPHGPADLSKFAVSVDSFYGWTAVTSVTTPISLGSLNAGENYTYTVRGALDASAGNEWSDVTLGVGVTITGTQA